MLDNKNILFVHLIFCTRFNYIILCNTLHISVCIDKNMKYFIATLIITITIINTSDCRSTKFYLIFN